MDRVDRALGPDIHVGIERRLNGQVQVVIVAQQDQFLEIFRPEFIQMMAQGPNSPIGRPLRGSRQ